MQAPHFSDQVFDNICANDWEQFFFAVTRGSAFVHALHHAHAAWVEQQNAAANGAIGSSPAQAARDAFITDLHLAKA